MDTTPNQSPALQPAEGTSRKPGKARVKPRHLSQVLKDVIYDQFRATHSTEDVAESMGLPVRTVTDVVLLEQMRRQPQPERGLSGIRRIA